MGRSPSRQEQKRTIAQWNEQTAAWKRERPRARWDVIAIIVLLFVVLTAATISRSRGRTYVFSDFEDALLAMTILVTVTALAAVLLWGKSSQSTSLHVVAALVYIFDIVALVIRAYREEESVTPLFWVALAILAVAAATMGVLAYSRRKRVTRR